MVGAMKRHEPGAGARRQARDELTWLGYRRHTGRYRHRCSASTILCLLCNSETGESTGEVPNVLTCHRNHADHALFSTHIINPPRPTRRAIAKTPKIRLIDYGSLARTASERYIQYIASA